MTKKDQNITRCLLIDDNPDDRALAARELKKEFPGLRMEYVTDMANLREQLQKGQLDLVITDYQLRWSDGLSVLRLIKTQMPDCPVIMFTGTGSEEIAVEAMKSGLDDYVLKSPKHYALLSARARTLLSRTQKDQQLRAAKIALSASESQLRAIIETEPECVKLLDAQGRLLFMNTSGLNMIQAESLEQVLGEKLAKLLLPKYRLAFVQLNERVMAGEKGILEFEIKGLRGQRLWLETHAVPLHNPDGTTTMLGITRDITVQKKAEGAREQLTAIIESATDFIGMVKRNGQMIYLNRAGRALVNMAPSEDVTATEISDYLTQSGADMMFSEGLSTAAEKGSWSGECGLMMRQGKEIPVSAVVVAHKNMAGTVEFYSTIMRDISERKEHEAQLLHLATHDALTGLPNRALYTDRLEVALTEAKRHQRLVAAMYLNLDRFKTINDTLGYETGNILIKAVGARLKESLRSDDTLARPGGDEFALVLVDIAQLDDVGRVTQKILNSFRLPFRLEGHEIFLTASVGIAVFPSDSRSAAGLLQNAAIALNRSKDRGGNTYQFYAAAMNEKALHRLALDNALHHALEREEFVLHYQPQVSLNTGQICGIEALLRWQHPKLDLVSPYEFISLAEQNGLIIPIGEWVLRTACAQNKAWQDQGLPALPIAVNLSGRQFSQPGLIQMITEALQQAGLAPQWLELEITESTLISDTQTSVALLNDLSDLGVRISIDDFGTGYSSLSYLKRFPIGTIKIDQSFVRDIHQDPDDAAIVRAIIAMAQGLNMLTIAEGVETQEQLAFLHAHQCDAMQGYYFGKPMRSEQLTEFLRSNPRLYYAS